MKRIKIAYITLRSKRGILSGRKERRKKNIKFTDRISLMDVHTCIATTMQNLIRKKITFQHWSSFKKKLLNIPKDIKDFLRWEKI